MSMNRKEIKAALDSADKAAREAGAIMRRYLHSKKRANFTSQHDIKLELDVRCQQLVERILSEGHPEIAVLGEEGETGLVDGDLRWVVDPIDGTVNFTYGIPHACVSIALQQRVKGNRHYGGYETLLGVVYDPFMDEMWDATKDGPARMNGKKIKVSVRSRLEECILAIGFSKSKESMELMLPTFGRLLPRIRKARIMGAAALSLSWVAGGRMDAFVESGVCLWDIAAGGLILDRAGGDFYCRPIAGYQQYRMIANNGLIRRKIERLMKKDE
jgi:myo-inositol-1(or 4)-monophosphatase